MTSSLDINGKKMHGIRYVSERTGYSRDYVTRLARDQKIIASQVGRQWYVDLDSLASYAAAMEVEQKNRQQQLSDERKRERQLKELLEKKEQEKVLHRQKLARRSKVLTAAVLLLGLCTGFALEKTPALSLGITDHLASAPALQEAAVRTGATTSDVDAHLEEAVELNFSQESFRLATLKEPAEGLLLLPASSTDLTDRAMETLFSDDVQIMTDEFGTQYVARVDAAGVVVEKIPYVIVPVTNEDMP